MQQFTLQQLFGANAFQTANELVINKSDLVKVRLTANSVNTAESLFIAITLYALSNFKGRLTDENNNFIADENNNPIEYDNRNLWELLEISHWGTDIPDEYIDRIRNQFIIYSYQLYAD